MFSASSAPFPRSARKPSERGDRIELQYIHCVWQAVDLLCAHPPHAHRAVRLESELGSQNVSLRVRSADPKVRVGEAIDHGVALDIAIADQRLPCISSCERRIAHDELRLRPRVPRRQVEAGPRENLAAIEADVLDVVEVQHDVRSAPKAQIERRGYVELLELGGE